MRACKRNRTVRPRVLYEVPILLLICATAAGGEVTARSSAAAYQPSAATDVAGVAQLQWFLDQAKTDLAKQAGRAALSYPETSAQFRMLGELAKLQVRAGETKSAVATCDTIERLRAQLPPDDSRADSADETVGEILAKVGQLQKAEALATRLELESSRSMVLREIAQEQARRGDMTAAKATLAKISSDDGSRGGLRYSAYFGVAVIQIRAKDLRGARRTLVEAGLNEESSFMTAQVDAGDILGAKSALLGASAAGTADPALLFEAVKVALKQGRRDLALEFLHAGEAAAAGTNNVPEVLGTSGRLRAALGDAAGARAAFQRAWELLDQQKLKGIALAYAASQIADDMARVGKASEALPRLRGLKPDRLTDEGDASSDPGAKIDLTIAAIQAFGGDIDAARTTLGRSTHQVNGPDGIHEVAAAGAEGGAFQGLRRWSASVQNPQARIAFELGAAEGILNGPDGGPQ